MMGPECCYGVVDLSFPVGFVRFFFQEVKGTRKPWGDLKRSFKASGRLRDCSLTVLIFQANYYEINIYW